MIKNSKVEWTAITWNPGQGCGKKTIRINEQVLLREECRYCYMYSHMNRFGKNPSVVVRSAQGTFNKPLVVQREVEKGLRPNFEDRLVFLASLTDFFNPEIDEWRPDAWDIIRRTPDLTYQILTKLPERIGDHLPPFWDEIKHRIWLGYTCGMPGTEVLIPELFGFGNPVNFLSCEPLTGYINLEKVLGEDKISWVIVGGESGTEARPMHPYWTEHILHVCGDYKVAIFFKQWGEWIPSVLNKCEPSKRSVFMNDRGTIGEPTEDAILEGIVSFDRVGVKKAGAKILGMEFKQFPKVVESQTPA